MNPKEEPHYGGRAVTDALVNAVVATYARQLFAVVLWKKSVKRDRARSNSVKLGVWSEQLDSHAPQRFTTADDTHGGTDCPL